MGLEQSLDHLISLLYEYPSLPAELADEAKMVLNRLSAGHFHLAVLGQFKRGKSTLINALLGDEILPSGVLPVTLVPVFLRFGDHPEIEIHFANGRQPERYPLDRLGEFVNEANNPENTKHVAQVDLRHPTDLLRNGIVLIDTPGVGSTLKHNTEVTLDFLPRCDAAIVVLSADPPITAAEVEFLQQLKPHVTRFFFVLNKIDYLDSQEVAEACRFLNETLKTSTGIDIPQIFALSARQGLQARRENNEVLWAQSGMADFQGVLTEFAVNGKQESLVEAMHRRSINLFLKADHLLALEQYAMQMPLETLEHKIAAFKLHARRADQQHQDMLDKLNGDARRLREQLEKFAVALQEEVKPQLRALTETFGLPTCDKEQAASFYQAAERLFDREHVAASAQFKGILMAILAEHTQKAHQLREGLRQDAANLLDIPHIALLSEEVVIDLAEPAWAVEFVVTHLRPRRSSKWFPQAWQHQQNLEIREQLVNELTVRNVEKIRWWMLRTIDESIHNFRRKITTELEETTRQIDYALQTGYQRQQFEKEALQETLSVLNRLRGRLARIQQELEEAALL
ncbi:MAG: dynamin family protein [Anaerolineae bacterium]|nr:dynamin family protein [Anaerolineae bacterium]